MTTSPHTVPPAVAELIAAYGAPDADATHLLCRRHPPDAVAFTVVDPDLTSTNLTFGELDDAAGRLAGGLARLGVSAGDRVATLMGRSAELVTTLLAIWRLGAVHVPLFTAFAPPAIALRTAASGARFVVADPDQRAKLDGSTGVIVTTGPVSGSDTAWADLLVAPPAEPVPVGGAGILIELFTSGTTGTPKAVPVPIRALAAMHVYQDYALRHTDDDVFWNAADPGWAYGLYHAILGPLATGRRSLLLRSGFSPELTWNVLARFGVTNFAAGPTVYRALRSAGLTVPDGLRLRRCSSAGEPLTPDIVEWAERELGLPVRDHYGQTETGMMVADAWHPDLVSAPVPGSMGRPLPGWTVDILDLEHDVPVPAGRTGRVAVDITRSPLMPFTGYRDTGRAGVPDRTAERFTADGRWYLTGDVATRAEDGRLIFGSRDDDIILMAGYRIGPFEVESVLARHPAVLEAAVVGEPDELRGEVLVAHVVLRDGAEAGETLTTELRQLVRSELGAHLYPRRVYATDALPRTPSGKIQRYQLRRTAIPTATGKERP
ncbi:AMP-binding protein [Prauserella endophytica]|uniref:AMP-dependent synthetase n=1 Tax=Prauserella endophytica TaxID=1592324 RepID=A0ABY2RYU1_9PSEU|nr:AMP-binding protein [Prauserella endophytica]PXY33503.1 AMP-dependent synthetase [Prauserella coralliicola]TKG65784.1 AMP-dependent synthetase [Prauserella endophytica]